MAALVLELEQLYIEGVERGNNEIFVYMLRYYSIEECRPYIDLYFDQIIASGDQGFFSLLVEKGYLNEGNREKIMASLINNSDIGGIDMLFRSDEKVTSDQIVAAARKGDVNVLRRMILFGADVNGMDLQGNTPFIAALREGNIDAARELILHNVNIEAADRTGVYPLMYAVADHRLHPLVEELIWNGADVNYRDIYGRTPLSSADVFLPTDDIRGLLISYGAKR